MKHRDAIRKLERASTEEATPPPQRRLSRRRPTPPLDAPLPSAEPSGGVECTLHVSTVYTDPSGIRGFFMALNHSHYRRRPLADGDAAAVVQNLDALGGGGGDDADADAAADAPLVQNLDARLRERAAAALVDADDADLVHFVPIVRVLGAAPPSSVRVLAEFGATPWDPCDLAVCQSGAAASQLWVRQRIARLRRAVADGGGGGGGALGEEAAGGRHHRPRRQRGRRRRALRGPPEAQEGDGGTRKLRQDRSGGLEGPRGEAGEEEATPRRRRRVGGVGL